MEYDFGGVYHLQGARNLILPRGRSAKSRNTAYSLGLTLPKLLLTTSVKASQKLCIVSLDIDAHGGQLLEQGVAGEVWCIKDK